MKVKNSLLALFTFLSVSAVSAMEPQVFEAETLSSISANGEWAAGQIAEGSMIIRNLRTGQYWTYFSNGGAINYFVGLGHTVSNNGIAIGATRTDNAAFWEKGKWTILKTPHPDFVNNTGSITPDGSVICGGVGLSPMSVDAVEVMLAPAVWYRQEDGGYGDAVILPYPKVDFTGRLPQYITAICISDDGKTIGGQIMDYTGYVVQPIIYQCDDNGEWTYRLFGYDLINPSNMDFPEWPGEFPEDVLMPTPEWYMTPSELEEFMIAFEEWDNTGTPPLYQDFMTPEEIAEYNEAMKEYLEIFNPWNDRYNKFMEEYYNCVINGSSFLFNSERITPDGKYFLTTVSMRNPQDGSRGKSTPVLYDIESGEYKTFGAQTGLIISDITADYTVLAYEPAPGADIGTRVAYIFPQMAEEAVNLYDYMCGINPEIGAWIEENMLQEVAIGLNSVGNILYRDMICTGTPVATPDMSLILTTNSTLSWFGYDNMDFISFLFPATAATDGIDKIGSPSGNAIGMATDGRVNISGIFRNMSVYDLTGKKIISQENPSDGSYLNLGKGIYVVKAVDADGILHNFKTVVSR